MNPLLKTSIALALALFLAAPARGESLAHSVAPMRDTTRAQVRVGDQLRVLVRDIEALPAQGRGLGTNPPAHVRQPSARTRLITAIAFVGGLAGLALLICGRGGCGR